MWYPDFRPELLLLVEVCFLLENPFIPEVFEPVSEGICSLVAVPLREGSFQMNSQSPVSCSDSSSVFE